MTSNSPGANLTCLHGAVVRLLIEPGARLDIRDTIWQGTPLAQAAMAECLRSLGPSE
jgi:hypothetical protein